MTRHFVSRLASLAGGISVLSLLAAAPPLRAQEVVPDYVESSSQLLVPGRIVDALPVDRAAEVLTLQPGVTTNNRGELLLRGGKPEDVAVYLDGMPIVSAFRSAPFFGLSRSRVLESRPGFASNALESITVQTGPLPADLGNGQSGVISVRTRDGGGTTAGGLSYESEEPFGAGNGVGFNRVLGELGGSLAKNVNFFFAGSVEGQRSIETGFESEQAPIFVRAGLDTTVAVPSALNDPFADTTMVEVYDLAVSRGQCDDFSASSNPSIADNYGFECRSRRTPGSAVSTYELLGKVAYRFGAGSDVSLLALAGQNQNRNFDYGTLYNAPGVTGNRASFSVIILGWRQQLNRSVERPLVLDTRLSFQSDHNRSGPLSGEGERSSANPFGGFLIRPLDLRFDFDNFPVDDELVRNYRTNLPGSRRSPYDLENTAQYSVVDQYRNNAYGLYSRDAIAPVIFAESGGPLGPLTLYREKRALGSLALSWQPDASHRLRVGGELTRYSIDNYFHFLESQSFSDVYIEHPIRGALFIQDRLQLGGAAITGGLRYDFYDTRARRWASFPRIFSHPLYDPADPEAFFRNDSLFPEDQSHSRVNPHIQASFPVGSRTVFRAGFAQQAQAPDFRQSLLGINTDISITGASTVYGSDLDFERISTFELGVRYDLVGARLSIDLALYSRTMRSQVTSRLLSRFDPSTATNRDLPILTNEGAGEVRGVDLKLERHWGQALSGSLAYSYQDATVEEPATPLTPEFSFAAPDSRPHSLAAGLALTVPGNWKRGSLPGAVLRDVGIFTLFRVASGTPYTRCLPGLGDDGVLSPEPCSSFSPDGLNGSRLPTYKQLDLRITRRFGPGGRFAGYLDARNLLNFRNVLAVFAVTGETRSPAEAATNWVADSADLAGEASASGVYRTNGSIDLGEGLIDPRVGCTTWVDQGGTPAAPNCVYLIRAEERFGNGDHIFDLTEQRRASESLYQAVRGTQELTGPPRRIRIGLELGF